MVANYTSNKPAEMLAFEAVDMKAACGIPFKIGNRLTAPEIDS